MTENSLALAMLETMIRMIGVTGYAMNTGTTGYICYSWIRARSPWQIEQARNWSITGATLIAAYSGIAAIGPIIAERFGAGIDTPNIVKLTPAYIGVIAIFSTRDPTTHTITWVPALLGAAVVLSATMSPGEGSFRTVTSVGILILCAHAATILNARIYRQGPAQAVTPENAAVLLGMDAGTAIYLIALTASAGG